MGKVTKLWKGLLAGGAGVAALAAVNAALARGHNEPEDTSPGGDAHAFPTRHGDLYYRAAGPETAPALVLLHGVGVGASSFIWRRNFAALARDFRVYAPDLLGFGLSEKPANVPYSPGFYVALVADFLESVARRPAHVVAHTLSAAFAVRVADERPDLVRSLVLAAPVLADTAQARPDLPGAAFYGLLHSPVLGTSFYNAMTSERSIRDYARKQLYFDRRRVTDRVVAHYYAMSHQPGAQYALAAYFSGYLATDARDAFARLAQDVTLVCGEEDETNPARRARAVAALNPRARVEVFERCRMMPQEEHPERFNALVRERVLAQTLAA